MISYCYGPDSYRRIIKVRGLTRATKEQYKGADFFAVDFSENPASWRIAKDFLKQQSMFTTEKILVVHESGEVEDKGEREWIRILKSCCDDAHMHIIISDSWEKPRKAFSFLLQAPVNVCTFALLSSAALGGFLKQYASERGVEMDSGAWKYFLKFIGEDEQAIWGGTRELKKISLMGFKSVITEIQLREVIRWTAHTDAFAAAHKLLARGDSKKKIMVLEWLLAQGEEPAKLFNLLAYVARGEDVVALADLDIAVKSGNAEYEEALLSFVLSR